MVLYVLATSCFAPRRHTPPGRVKKSRLRRKSFFFCTSNATVLEKKHNVDIHAKRTRSGETALDRAEEYGMTECAAVLRGYGATNGEPVEEEDWTESDDWDSDDNSDADHDVM